HCGAGPALDVDPAAVPGVPLLVSRPREVGITQVPARRRDRVEEPVDVERQGRGRRRCSRRRERPRGHGADEGNQGQGGYEQLSHEPSPHWWLVSRASENPLPQLPWCRLRGTTVPPLRESPGQTGGCRDFTTTTFFTALGHLGSRNFARN